MSNITQEDFDDGTYLSVPYKYFQSIEGGKQNVTILTLVKIAKRLDVDVENLFEDPED